MWLGEREGRPFGPSVPALLPLLGRTRRRRPGRCGTGSVSPPDCLLTAGLSSWPRAHREGLEVGFWWLQEYALTWRLQPFGQGPRRCKGHRGGRRSRPAAGSFCRRSYSWCPALFPCLPPRKQLSCRSGEARGEGSVCQGLGFAK